MCLSASLVGVLVFIRKRSLIGEALSHAAYPGVVLTALFFALFFPEQQEALPFAFLVGAFLSALGGLFLIDWLQRVAKIKNDAALSLVLALFFGVGILIASRMQITHALFYQQIQVFLYGQAATMLDVHVIIYALLAMVTVCTTFLLYRLLLIVNFDREFATVTKIWVKGIDAIFFFLLVLSIVIGIRSVGVVLMSGMLIVPAAAARFFARGLASFFCISAFFGLISGFLGNYLSVELPRFYGLSLSLPTGPMILLSSVLIFLFALFFSKERGLVRRYVRIFRFKQQCLTDNVLKALWKRGEGAEVALTELQGFSWRLTILLRKLRYQGWVVSAKPGHYRLSADGWLRALRIVRLHRLWEVYLVTHLGQGKDRVHRNAEEIEHILTPELEQELTELLQDPKQDPHDQPIPGRPEVR